MRRIVSILLTLCLCLSLSSGVMAAPYADISALFQYWEQFGYPEDVAGVYSTDGSSDHLTVLLIGDTDGSREAEIRAMLNDDSEVTFEPGTYSQERLQQINQEITDGYLYEGSGVYSCGIGWGADGGFGESGSEFRVVVTVDETRLEEYTAAFSGVYGDAVVVEAGEQPVLTMEEEMTLATELPEAPNEHDLYGDLTEEPVEAPQKDSTEAQPSAQTSAQTTNQASRTGTNLTLVLMIAGIVVAAAAGCAVLWFVKKK